MPTDKNKKEVKVRDLKPSKDAKGGAGRRLDGGGRHSTDGGGKHTVDGKRGPAADGKFSF